MKIYHKEISTVKNTENSALIYPCDTCEPDTTLLVRSMWATLAVITSMIKAVISFFFFFFLIFFALPDKG